MKKQVMIYGAAAGILDIVIFLAYLYGVAMEFTSVSFTVALFLPFVAYIFLESYLCGRYEIKPLVFAAWVIGSSFLSLVLILFLIALITRNFRVLEGVGWIGMFMLYAYAGIIGLRLLWQVIQRIRMR